MPVEGWRVRVQDILGALERTSRYIHSMDLQSFATSQMVMDAVVYNFVVIGESTRHIPGDIQAQHPEIPWAEMRGMRNFVVHEYFSVSPRVLWETATHDLPPLAPALRALLE